jgi:hypothetical protein
LFILRNGFEVYTSDESVILADALQIGVECSFSTAKEGIDEIEEVIHDRSLSCNPAGCSVGQCEHWV